jgi:hypothetical protein
VRARDTSDEAARVQAEIYRKMTHGQRAEIAAEMSAMTRELTRSGIRSRHPGYNEQEVEQALRRLFLGDELYRKAWPDLPLLDP